ncbi:MAG: hypothetical protein IJ880_03655 [Bacilli bacterium]|nr:hypothetical protein [Bacilli bacterium]MBR3119783.1 hypothetical protein [Oceanobacillus sp.]
MSAILNQIKEMVSKNINVEVHNTPQYGKYPVVVRDNSTSITSGWELLYKIDKSKFNGRAMDYFGHFSEVRIPQFNNLYTLVQQVYSQFKQGVNVEQRYDTNFATYQPNEKLWFTALERKNGVNIKLTITDDASPLHLLSINFFITISNETNQPYLVGYDSAYNQQADVFVDRYNAQMLPKKKRYVPIYKNDGISTIKAAGQVNQQGLVQIDEVTTDIVYLQETSNERQLLASVYEKAIIEIVLEKSNELFTSNESGSNWNNQISSNSPFNMQQPVNAFNNVQSNTAPNAFTQNMVPTGNVF